MASTETAGHSEAGKLVDKAATPSDIRGPAERAASSRSFAAADVVLRFLLFASGVVAVVVMVTSKQTELIPIPIPPFLIPRPAKFNQSPAFIYFVAALSVAGLYGAITTLISLFALCKPASYPRLLSHFVIFDVLLFGIVAAATGTAGGVGYIGLKGNSHVQWRKICDIYGEFCRHIGASIAVSLFGSVVLALLVLLSIYSLSKRIPKHSY
ncbi:CASP-like protein 1D1 [Sesamum angolense]|uniref:CASP-like protein n=1 Tax=Sesamum angolense TaxID=2727404 RepID=A0AAE2C1L3_9LAMI|nr:CASP-like protein 1D1 [Sesamum angolense]